MKHAAGLAVWSPMCWRQGNRATMTERGVQSVNGGAESGGEFGIPPPGIAQPGIVQPGVVQPVIVPPPIAHPVIGSPVIARAVIARSEATTQSPARRATKRCQARDCFVASLLAMTA